MKILVVDDEENARILLTFSLQARGYEVETAENGREAFEVAQSFAPDLIVSDILMPEMDGFDLCRHIKSDERLREVPFIFYTATYTEPRDQQLAMELGASLFIVKPVEPDIFLGEIERVIEDHQAGKLSVPAPPVDDARKLEEAHEQALTRKLAKKVRELRESERVLQSTLDGLSANITLLDEEGRILLVNKAWRDFARENGLSPEVVSEGADYLRVCDGASGENAGEASAFAKGVRRVLSEELPFFALEYPCHSPHEQRWFVGRVTPFPGEGPRRVVVAHENITERRRSEEAVVQAFEEISQLKERLEAENVYLQDEIRTEHDFEELVGESPAWRNVLRRVEQVAPTDSTALLMGETGTGKELIARAVHARSLRRDRPLVKVNCAALPSTLIESELFGHEKGAFTGATSRREGRFQLADGGTIFLDEIGDLGGEAQAKLLRVLQEGEVERLGSSKLLKVDVRVIAATNRRLEKAVAEGAFRQDLYYRLNVFPIVLPPLRERRKDIPLLVRHFIATGEVKLGKRFEAVPQRVMEALVADDWPGNARQLQNLIEQAMILSSGPVLEVRDASFLTPPGSVPDSSAQTLEEIERGHILRVVEQCGWKITGKGNAADRLGLNPSTLRSRMKKLGIERR